MPEQQFDTLPSEAQELPQGAQNIFKAAFKSASDDGMSEDAATSVAWNSVKAEYNNESGTWVHKGDDTNQTNRSVQSGGN